MVLLKSLASYILHEREMHLLLVADVVAVAGLVVGALVAAVLDVKLDLCGILVLAFIVQ